MVYDILLKRGIFFTWDAKLACIDQHRRAVCIASSLTTMFFTSAGTLYFRGKDAVTVRRVSVPRRQKLQEHLLQG